VRRLDEPALPARHREGRQRHPRCVEAAAGECHRALTRRDGRGRSLQRDAVRGAAGHDEQVAGTTERALAVADPLPAWQRVHIQHGRAHRQGPAFPPATGECRSWAYAQLRAFRADAGEVVVGEVRHQHGARVEPRRLQRTHPRPRLLEPVAGHRQVQGQPLQPQPGAGTSGGGEVVTRHAVPPHRRQALHDHPGSGRFRRELREVTDTGEAVDDPPVGHVRLCAGPPRLHHQHVARASRQHVRHVQVGADRHRVQAQPLATAGQGSPCRSRSRCPWRPEPGRAAPPRWRAGVLASGTVDVSVRAISGA
jgi:hypothetical protein